MANLPHMQKIRFVEFSTNLPEELSCSE